MSDVYEEFVEEVVKCVAAMKADQSTGRSEDSKNCKRRNLWTCSRNR